jgi:hypothetical protein
MVGKAVEIKTKPRRLGVKCGVACARKIHQQVRSAHASVEETVF